MEPYTIRMRALFLLAVALLSFHAGRVYERAPVALVALQDAQLAVVPVQAERKMCGFFPCENPWVKP